MFRKKLGIGMAAIGMMAAASVANAGLILDLRAQDGTKAVTVQNVGDVVTLNLYARVIGTNGSITDDGLQTIYESFVSTPANGGSAIGDFSTFTTANGSAFTGNVQAGHAQDLNGLPGGDLGTGVNVPVVTGDYVYNRAGSMQIGTGTAVGGNPAASEWLIGSLSWTVTSVPASGTTVLSVLPRNTSTAGGAWREDGVNKQSSVATFTAGADVAVNVVPEPASLSLLVVSALGLVIRRRRQA